MNRTMHKQRGMTGVSWMMLLALVGLVLFLAIKIVPIYLENYQVKSVLAGLAEEPSIATMSQGEIYNSILKRLGVNGINELRKDNIEVDKSPGALSVVITYDVEKPLIANLEVIAYFEEVLELEFR